MYCIAVIRKQGPKSCFARESNVLNCLYDPSRDDIEILSFGEAATNFFHNERILMNSFSVFLPRSFYAYLLCYEYLHDFANESRLTI